MQRYLLRRVITAVPTLFGITVLIFVAMRILPGDPLAQIAGEGVGQYRLSDDELKAFVKDRLAPYKYPRFIEFINELPKTATGKIQRFKLRERERA